MRNLYLSNKPVSYRMDFYRELAQELNCEICFQEMTMEAEFPVRRWTLHSLPSLLTAYRPSLVFVPEFSAAAILCLRLRKKYGYKVISTCDDSLDMIHGNDFGWKHRLARNFVPRRLDEIILHSPDVAGWYRDRFGKGLFMPIIADERRVRPELARVLPLSAQLRAGDKPVVAFVGRFVGLKNIPSLIRAFEPLKHRAQLVLIGDGLHRTALEAMAPEALFPGMLAGDDLLAWYNLIDIVVLPSTQEAYGAVTGEALMAGAKVVVSEKAGSADLVREGENGYRVPPMDLPALTDRIGRLLDEVPSGRPLTLRENRLPYRFETCIRELIDKLKIL
ncbi:MAG: glycosyltransferase family 4 protein [Bacteroidales bacterium]|nr:glycosyltransferase family 4 protein [Bacteroidales bacterium]